MSKKTREQISYNMSRVKNKDSEIELLLRKELWNRGLRYQKNVTSILGKPDIVFKGPKVVVFCDSEFWHGYNWEAKRKEIKSNQSFWYQKIERNMQRDIEVTEELQKAGWIVLRYWGKDIKKRLPECADQIEAVVRERKQCRLKPSTYVPESAGSGEDLS